MRPWTCKALSGRRAPASDGTPRPRGSAAIAVSGVILSALAGCGGPVVTFHSKAKHSTAEPASTGSIGKPPASFGRDLDAEDWRRARAALGVALDPQGDGRPVKWDNPDTAARGSISPAGLPYVANDEVCRDFRASVVTATASRSLRGTGCKPSGHDWVLKRLRAERT